MKYVIGIDEVGRGSLAGPVLVCAVAVARELRIKNKELGKLQDSKKLSPARRERWFDSLKNHPKIAYTFARVYPRRIEKINISKAANLAALRAFLRLASNLNLRSSNAKVYLDGGLYLGDGPKRIPAKTMTRGDQKIKAIKIASIIAKVSRDRFMTRLAKKYPAYSLEIHKGYGTKVHLAAIKKFGPSEVHRLTFISKCHTI